MREIMYKKIVNTFFNELKNDNLLKLPNDFYDSVRDYLNKYNENGNNNDINNPNMATELERINYYISELRKLRLYKAFFGNRDNLVDEEQDILLFIEDITYYHNFKNLKNIKDNSESLNTFGNPLNDYNLFESELNNSTMTQDIRPKPINTQNDIDIVRVNTRFPEFTDGKYTYLLNKNDILTLNKKFSKILEKHNIVKKINGE